jgi:hypothetical protein
VEMWECKVYAMSRLREVGGRFRKPELSIAFGQWRDRWFAKSHRDEVRALEMSTRSVEAQLRHAHFENGQIEMRRAAQEEEIAALRSRVRQLNHDALEKDVSIAEASTVAQENATLKHQLLSAKESLLIAEASKGEAQADSAVQRKANKELVERLLGEQRRLFEEEMESTKATMLARTKEWALAAQKRYDAEAELKEMREQVATLKSELEESKRRKAPSPGGASFKSTPKDLPRTGGSAGKKKASSPLGPDIDLDEGPDAPPVAVQLGNALRTRHAAVLGLFRSWDDNGDGEVSRSEFHRAMPALGLEVPKKAIDELFDEWDKDGGGAIDFNELKKILQAKPPPAQKTKKAVQATIAAKRMGSAVSMFSHSPAMAQSKALAKGKPEDVKVPSP